MNAHLKHRVEATFRHASMGFIGRLARLSPHERVEFQKQKITKILLVRPSFRMGNSILATPAIFLFQRNFPEAQIDFLGSPISEILFQNLPIERHYAITRQFPDASWAYFALARRIRSARYDLAVEVSGSQSATGALFVGVSGARFRVGCRGKWDQWFNVKVGRPDSKSKYEILPRLVSSLGLTGDQVLPSIVLTPAEKETELTNLASLLGESYGADVGVFVGARISGEKRWPKEQFVRLISGLRVGGKRVIVFVGPEEEDILAYYRRELRPDIPVIYEPSLRKFAGMIAACKLFVTCDSGPMHLACALRVRTVAVFLKANFQHWGPPASLARIAYEEGGISYRRVLHMCLEELSHKHDDPLHS